MGGGVNLIYNIQGGKHCNLAVIYNVDRKPNITAGIAMFSYCSFIARNLH